MDIKTITCLHVHIKEQNEYQNSNMIFDVAATFQMEGNIDRVLHWTEISIEYCDNIFYNYTIIQYNTIFYARYCTLSLLQMYYKKKQKQTFDLPISWGTLTYNIDTKSC